ncbi:MAG: hypothetical protein H7328_00155 [Bdellovibrio sp.]|nr:hypothetical protein [Bdellovibrio sp.]
MSFKREILPQHFAEKEQLSKDMASIGFLVTALPSNNPNIENTIIAVSIEGLNGDLRSLSLLVNWLEIHRGAINADRLIKMIWQLRKNERLICFWTACAKNILVDSRFKKLKKFYKSKRLDLLNIGTEFQLGRFGEDLRFEKSCLRVPANTLRNRPRDILSSSRLVKLHTTYRYRIMIGPSYRADQWALLEYSKNYTSSELARLSFSSFGSAWQAKQDFEVLSQAS